VPILLGSDGIVASAEGMASPWGCARVGVPETFVDGDIAA